MLYETLSATERRTLPPAVAVSTVAFALHPPEGAARKTAEEDGPTLWIPLVRRTRAPFLGHWALPGGPTQWDETLSDTALRTLRDAVLRDPGYLEQLYSFGGIERSAEAQRLVTIAYWALYGEHDLAARAGDRRSVAEDDGRTVRENVTGRPESRENAAITRRWDDPGPVGAPSPSRAPAVAEERGQAAGWNPMVDPGSDRGHNVAWFSADRLPDLAFDHAEIVGYALTRLRVKTEYASVAHRFLRPEFTLGQLRAVHEAILGHRVDPANFRRQALAQGTLVDTGEFETGTRHRPARLYRFRDESGRHESGRDEPGQDEPVGSEPRRDEPERGDPDRPDQPLTRSRP